MSTGSNEAALWAIAAIGALTAACSSAPSAGVPGTDEEFQSAVEALSSTHDMVAPGEEPSVPSDTAPSSGSPSSSTAAPACHPHLFERSVLYADALDYHVYVFSKHIDALLALGPHTKTATTQTWTYTAPGGDSVQLALKKTALGVFSATEAVAPPGSTSYTTVLTGSVDRSDPADVKTAFTVDFTALHTVVPPADGDHSAGQLSLDIERTEGDGGADSKRVVTFTLTDFVPVYGDPHGPRSGDVYFLEEPGVGGAMLYDSSLVFFCPANPSGLAADADVYARWFVSGSGASASVAGRADARATGGQFPSGDTWVGLSCRDVTLTDASSDAVLDDNGYWMMKEEAADGSTVVGSAVEETRSTQPPCDPAFGPVTDLGDDATDPTLPTTIPAAGAFPGEF